MTPPRVIVTRPAQEAERWVRDLRVRGWVAEALPLIAILPVADAAARAAIQQARARLGGYRAAMFVSGHAVRYFFDADADAGEALAGMETGAWATGPGTARALAQAGWPPMRIDVPDTDAGEQADSEALWARVQAQIQPGARVLIVRGGDASGRPAGRAWLTDQLAAAGAQVDTVAAYRRAPPVWDAAQQALARAALQDGSVWLLNSSEAAANLSALGRDLVSGLIPQNARAVATHPRIARAARAAGFGAVIESRPTLDAVIRSIESFA
ncbi:MAG: uroporphyrinogen-III synthase [Burkholderiaceae bacterium]|jgi:uroporphyrinogen-III synthase|nr:uroporphyrinogen-III synthase [Burkholderiaceae bacterium]